MTPIGPDIRDEALILFANILNSIFNNRSYTARFGGDEFSLYLYDIDITDFNLYINKLFKELSLSKIPGIEKPTYLEISVGATQIKKDFTFRELYEETNKLLYEAKEVIGSNIIKNF